LLFVPAGAIPCFVFSGFRFFEANLRMRSMTGGEQAVGKEQDHGIREGTALGRQELERRMELGRAAEEDELALAPIRRGWCLGSEEFKRQMLARMDGQLGAHHAGDLHREQETGRAERLIAEELGRLGWGESDLVARRKSDPGKLALAARLRRETTMPLKWIAARAHLGTSKSANSNVHRWMKAGKQSVPEAKSGG
jgi:hypothetical protein